jgi:3-oxoacyl-(acyl-carrier-protein) synthase
MTNDWSYMNSKDPDAAPQQTIMGFASSILPNRISWYFDLHGPSVHLDTACSSGMVALDMACKAIHDGDATAVSVIIFIANDQVTNPSITVWLTRSLRQLLLARAFSLAQKHHCTWLT